jgi:hypothetical protein
MATAAMFSLEELIVDAEACSAYWVVVRERGWMANQAAMTMAEVGVAAEVLQCGVAVVLVVLVMERVGVLDRGGTARWTA